MHSDFNNAPPSLPPLLDEFRAALQDEIEVAKRNSSSSAIPLSNGHKVSDQGRAHQYAFLIDSVLNTPDGAPGDLIIPGKAPMGATIVSTEGLRIVISVETDLGKFVPVARLQTNLAILMRKLIERIESNASSQNPAADRMLGFVPGTGVPIAPAGKPKLNESQLTALQSALGRNLTFIWGPPGTGKTHTIGTIAEYLHKEARSVLLVSHTNTAVDQAIRHIANSLKEELPYGAVVRVGDVKDEVLKNDHPDVLLKKQVELQSLDLVGEREKLIVQRQTISDEISAVQQSISIIEWLATANDDIHFIEKLIDEVKILRQEEEDTKTEVAVLAKMHPKLLELHETTSKILSFRKLLHSYHADWSGLQSDLKTALAEREHLAGIIQEQTKRIAIAKRIEPIRNERATYPSPTEQKETISHLSSRLSQVDQKLVTIRMELDQASALLLETEKAGAISRVFRRLPKPEAQLAIVNELNRRISDMEIDALATRKAVETASSKLARMIEIDGELARYDSISSCFQEIELKTKAELQVKLVEDKINEVTVASDELLWEMEKIEAEIEALSQPFDGDAKDFYIEICSKLKRYKDLQVSVSTFGKRIDDLHRSLETKLKQLLSTIGQWVEIADLSATSEEAVKTLSIVHGDLSAQYSMHDLASLRERGDTLGNDIRKLMSQIAEIDAILAEVEREVINKASVIGATLTKTYLSDVIQGRRFDTVILDEASMAPIPALWVAALLAENNLIIVGDFKQLPPIVLSNNELTKKWLGRDIFEVSGLKEQWNKKNPPPHFVPLVEQRRMLPEIADVANQFYGMLKNAFTVPEQYEDFPKFKDWYVKNWPHDNPVLLVDIGPLNAWVTSVVKGGNSSRLNFLSATVAVDLSEQLLSLDRPKRCEGDPKRILIVSPYRAHAKLVSVLLKDVANLQDEVVAGTAHSFQGSEADVVIFDLVVDEPHFRVNLFMPTLDEQLKCLLNVALTRAKFRLVVLGDFDYCLKKGKKAFLGRDLLPYLLDRFPRIDARDIVPGGLAGRAAKAQMTMLGGDIDPDADRIVVTQVDFYRLLANDLCNAQQRTIIYSPFITTNRLAFLLPQIQAAIERGVQIYVITKAHSERSKTEMSTIRKTEAQLSEVGAVVIHKLRMHEKLVFIDDDVTWAGSLNPLSFSNTQEIMERRKSKAVLKDYFQILRLQELVAVQETQESKCPICGKEMIAAEGADQPYYWRCINDNCFSRSIDQPYPFDGVLRCGNCNAPVEYGEWGDYPHWRCTANNRHRQKIFKAHLRLPKMAALVPKNDRRKLCRLLHLKDFDEHIFGSQSSSRPVSVQRTLFD